EGDEAPRRRQEGVFHHGPEDQPPRPADRRRGGLRREMGKVTMTEAARHHYRPTEAKYKGGAEEMYVTYDLSQETRGGGHALYPKVQRVYIAGQVKDWHTGTFARRTGKEVHGIKIDYEQSRAGYQRKGYTATRG